MIQVSRSLIRQFRGLLRRTLSFHKGAHPPIVFETGREGLTIRAQHEGIALSCQIEGRQPSDSLMIPGDALEELEGRGSDLVTLVTTDGGKVLAQWNDASVPREKEYQVDKEIPNFPKLPDKLAENGGGLIQALDEAMQTASSDSVRFATNHIQLRGKAGEMVATDGKQLLTQSCFRFPWSEDVLVPRVKVFGCGDLAEVNSVRIGCTKDHVCLRVGQWTIFLPISQEGRFPRVEMVIPKVTNTSTQITFDAQDASYLTKALPRLPGNDDENAPITLDLNGQVAVRAKDVEQDRATEAILSRSQFTGKQVRFASNREYLARALNLGFTQAHIIDADTPILFQDDHRKYVFMGLGKDAAIAPTEKDLRLTSDSETPIRQTNERTRSTVRTSHHSEPRELTPPITDPPSAETPTTNHHHKTSGFHALLEEAQSIQNTLRDALLRTNQLLSGLKQYRRQAKTVQSTLASLRQLQQVEA